MNYAPPARIARWPRLPRLDVVRVSILIAVMLLASSWFFILELDRQQPHSFLSAETFRRASSFLGELFGVGAQRSPAFTDGREWLETGVLAYRTLLMSVLAIGLSGFGALLTFMLAARNVMLGELGSSRFIVGPSLFFLVRGIYTFTRAVPELVWAMLVVFVITPGILPGAIALAIHNFGVLGKLAAEVVEGLDMRAARALQASGASRAQVLVYGILPQALPRFLTYLFYRWEVIIRTTIVVGFVSAGGLGMAFRIAMSHFHYTTITLILAWYLILVAFVDLTAAGMRRLAR